MLLISFWTGKREPRVGGDFDSPEIFHLHDIITRADIIINMSKALSMNDRPGLDLEQQIVILQSMLNSSSNYLIRHVDSLITFKIQLALTSHHLGYTLTPRRAIDNAAHN